MILILIFETILRKKYSSTLKMSQEQFNIKKCLVSEVKRFKKWYVNFASEFFSLSHAVLINFSSAQNDK